MNYLHFPNQSPIDKKRTAIDNPSIQFAMRLCGNFS